MLVQIRDRAALSSLPSTNLRHYLKTHGWKDAGRWGRRATIYTKKYGRRNWEILIPLSDTVADYAERMAESIAILATAEDRSQLDVFYDVLEAGSGEAQELVKTINGQKKQAKEAVQKVRQNLAAFPLDRAISEADSLQRDGKIEEAIEKWRSIANVSEGIDDALAAHAWFFIGFLLRQRDMENTEDHIQDVIFSYDRAIALNPSYAEAYNNRGDVKSDLGQYKAAITDYDRVIALNPSYVSAYINRGTVKGVLGQHKAAIADFDQAIDLKPDYVEAYCNRGLAKGNLGDQEAAIADFDRAIHLNPDLAKAYSHRGIARGNLGDHETAIADFDQAIRLNPDDVLAYYNRGIARFSLGEYQAAITDNDQVIHLKSDYSEAYYNRGLAKFVLGDQEAAIADFDRAIERDPDDALAYYNRGNANAILDRKTEARVDFETALDLANRSGNTDLKSRIEQQLQVIKETVNTSDSVRKTKDWLRSPPVYDSFEVALFAFSSPVVNRSSIRRALVEQ